jgi:hypothetical protein
MTSAAHDFVSKRDTWLVSVIWASVAVGGAALLPAVWAARCEPVALVASLVGCIGLALGPWVLYGTRYTFERDRLRIRCGPFRWRVPCPEITRVEPSTNPLSSPACSLDRLLIQYGAGQILVSPLDRAGFLRQLAALCPQLRLDGERLVASR